MKKITFFILGFATIIAGCVPYPIYKTLRPASTITVTDNKARAVEGAQVILIANAHPTPWEQSRTIKQTDALGKAAFEAEKEWRVEAMALHGSLVFYWNWCVQKPGYTTYNSSHSSSRDFERDAKVVLTEGESKPCPASNKVR